MDEYGIWMNTYWMWNWNKIFFQFCRLLLCLNNWVLCLVEAFQFCEVPYINCDLSTSTTAVLFRKASPLCTSSRLFSSFSSISFSVTGFMVRPLLPLEFSFGQGDNYIYILLHTDSQSDHHYLLKMLSFIQCVFMGSLLKHRCPQACGLCLGLQFESIHQYACFYANSMWFLLL